MSSIPTTTPKAPFLWIKKIKFFSTLLKIHSRSFNCLYDPSRIFRELPGRMELNLLFGYLCMFDVLLLLQLDSWIAFLFLPYQERCQWRNPVSVWWLRFWNQNNFYVKETYTEERSKAQRKWKGNNLVGKKSETHKVVGLEALERLVWSKEEIPLGQW